MAKFKSDTAFYGTKEGREFEAGKEFEMNIDRAKEVVANGKKNHNLDIKLTRLDGEQPKGLDKDADDKAAAEEAAAEKEAAKAEEEKEAEAPKEDAKKTTKKAKEDK